MTAPALTAMEQQLPVDFPQRRVALAHGRSVFWREAGDATQDCAVVLLHGISSGAASWLGVAQHLGAHCRVLAWDAPGYGASSPLAEAAPRDLDYAQTLEASLQALGVRRCMLVGHSLGALMAAAFAREPRSVQVEQLVLCSPAGGYGAAAQVEQQARVRQERQWTLASQGIAGLAANIDQRLLSPGAPQWARQWVRCNTLQLQAQGYLQAVELLCRSDLALAVDRLTMPVQVWVGEHDVVTPPSACADWARQLGARFATLAGAGHASPVEQPQSVAASLLAAWNDPQGGNGND